MPARPWSRGDTATLAALLAAFVGTRWLWLHDLPSSAFYWEESYRWVALQVLAQGADRALVDLQADHYQGGSLVAIALARLISLATGTGLATLKIAALVFSSATLAMIYAIGRRFFGRTTGSIAAAAYVCGPPLVAFWGVCLMGFHSEGVLPSLALVYATLALVAGAWTGAGSFALAGALATLSIWFTPTAAIAVVACALAWLLVRGRPRPADALAAGAGAAVGLVPWLAYNATRGFPGLDRIVDVFADGQSNDVFRAQSFAERAIDLVARAPTEGLVDPGGVLVDPFARLALIAGFALPVWVGVLAAGRRLVDARSSHDAAARDSARLELVFWLYLVVFALAYLASRFTLEASPRPIAFRLFVPPAVMMMVPLASSAARGLRLEGRRRVASALATGLCLVSLATATTALALRYEAAGAPLTEQGGYLVLGRLTQRKSPQRLDRSVAELRWIEDETARAWASYGLGWGITEYYEQSGDLAELDGFVARMPGQPYVLLGMHWGIDVRTELLRAEAGRDGRADLDRALERLAEIKRKLPPVMTIVDGLEGDHSAGPASNLLR